MSQQRDLFEKMKRLKARISQERVRLYGKADGDRDKWLAQLEQAAQSLKVENPYPAPSLPVDPGKAIAT